MAAVGVLSIYFFFYQQINSGFSRILGNEYDSVIQAVLLSHWYRVFEFGQDWTRPLYFHPHTSVLGYNDGYFIYGVISTLYRLLGFDLFVSQELTHVAVKAVGFLSMAALLGRLQQKNIVALLGAAMFTLFISSGNAQHGQLHCVAFSPLLTLLLIEVLRSISQGRAMALAFYWVAFSAVYGSLLLTGFYMAWFFGLFAIIYTAFYACLEFEKAKAIVHFIFFPWHRAALIALLFLLAVAPFLYVYLPKLKETGGQGYENQMAYSLHLVDVLNFGGGSLLWGEGFDWAAEYFPGFWRSGEFRVGLTPDVFALLVLIVVGLILRRFSWPTWLRALACATAVAMMLPMSFFGHSLWGLVNMLIPGGRGVRVIARFYIFLAFPISILVASYFARLWQLIPRYRMPIIVLMTIVCAGQINLKNGVNLDVVHQMTMLNRASPPPQTCAYFFVDNVIPAPEGFVDKMYRQNVQAMLLADKFGIPTLNGFSTFNPPDWIFQSHPEYLNRVAGYVRGHKLHGVCRYDFGKNEWLAHAD